MKIKLRNHFPAEVATASLNDIMFFLLLFFLIISTVTNPNVIKVLLPKTSSNQALTKQPITLTVTANKAYYINRRPVSKDQLEAELITACKGMSEPTVVLRVSADLTIQELVTVMQIGVKNKMKM